MALHAEKASEMRVSTDTPTNDTGYIPLDRACALRVDDEMLDVAWVPKYL